MLSADTPDSCHLQTKNIFITMYNSTLNQCSSTARQDKIFTTKENKPIGFLFNENLLKCNAKAVVSKSVTQLKNHYSKLLT
jgi:hypothetical protein